MESEWQKLKRQVPGELPVRALEEIRVKMNYVRAAQWRRLVRGEDKWQAWCQAAKRWREERANEGSDQQLDSSEEELSGCEAVDG